MSPRAVQATTESHAIFGVTMHREYLSSALTVPMKFVSGAMLAFALPATVVAYSNGRLEFLLVLILVGAFAGFSWIQSVVFIEDGELVVEGFGRSIRVRPEDIRDVAYLGPTRLLKVSFTRSTRLGKWIVFAARPQSVLHDDGPIGDDGPVFKRLGELCGWRND